MSNIAKLKKKAADLELKKQSDKALAVYIEILAEFEKYPEEMDIGMYNRVGDLLLKQGNVADAVDYYEKAVDFYGDGGFFNNAIALCNKILRQSPGRASVYYKLGKMSAQKGFSSEAKRNFLEYADRVRKAGKMDEAFRALKEFADLCPDQDDIRLMLADQLQKQGKPDEAVEQLQLLYARYSSEGRTAEAEATAERIHAINPDVEIRTDGPRRASSAQDLVFLNLDDEPAAPAHPSKTSSLQFVSPEPVAPPAPPPQPAPAAPPAQPEAVEPLIERAEDLGGGLVIETPAGSLDGVTRVTDMAEAAPAAPAEAAPLDGLEATSFGSAAPADAGTLLDLEPTSFGAMDEPLADQPIGGTSSVDASAPVAPAAPAAGGSDELLDLDDALTLGGFTAAEPAPPAAPPAAPEPAEAEFEAPSLEFAEPEPEQPDVSPTAGLPLMSLTPLDGVPAVPAEPVAEEEPAHADDGESAAALSDLPLLEDDSAPIPTPTAPVGRSSTLMAVQSVEMLQAVVEGTPEDWDAHRELGEAMLDAGDRAGGLRELEVAMAGYERANDLDAASSVADEIVRVDPGAVKFHQKRVEYAFRANDKHRLVDAYLELADALFRAEQPDKARVVYQRVLDLAPDDLRAQAALSSLPEPQEPEAEEPPAPAPRASVVGTPMRATPGAPPPAASDDAFVNLGDWLREDEAPKDTRMVVEEKEPTGDEQADFADMLAKFKQGVAENVEEEDYDSHYDLGVAYKEMGLLDEAIAEFQKALRGADNRVRTYEAIGQCFMEKEQYQMASTLLSRALSEKGMSDDKLVGVLYLLGRAAEALGKPDDALGYYQRIFVVDIQFRDVADRMNAIERAPR